MTALPAAHWYPSRKVSRSKGPRGPRPQAGLAPTWQAALVDACCRAGASPAPGLGAGSERCPLQQVTPGSRYKQWAV